MRGGAGDGDLYLGSVAEAKGLTVHATDGDLGPVENILADNANWDIRYLVVATRHWLPGKLVQLAPYAVTNIDWSDHRVSVNVTRDQVKSAPRLGPRGHDGQGRGRPAAPAFRLAGLRLVAARR